VRAYKPPIARLYLKDVKTNPETNKSQIGKLQNTESEGSLFGILPIFGYLKLFRISDFVLRIFCSWRLCAFARVIAFSISLFPKKIGALSDVLSPESAPIDFTAELAVLY
jgi:hypothetical protein